MLQITWQHKQAMKIGTVSRWSSEIRNRKPLLSLFLEYSIISECHSQLLQNLKNLHAAMQDQLAV